MKYAREELKLAKQNLKDNLPVKIHLALELDGKTKNLVETLNYRLSLLKENEVKYYNSVLKPQITMVSGNVQNRKDYNEVKDLLGTLFNAFRIGELDLHPTKYYFSQDGKWLLLGLKPNEFLTGLTSVLKDFLRSYVDFEFEHELHITIAKFKDDCSKKLNIGKLPLPEKVHLKNAIYGLSGSNGGMLKKVKKYKI
ncbi:MAG: hypothetical protein MJ149_03160 [Clostridia bacterium]|nr:hypothetical protein [Clostridia bacterium]